jgi:hypothetical protein
VNVNRRCPSVVYNAAVAIVSKRGKTPLLP